MSDDLHDNAGSSTDPYYPSSEAVEEYIRSLDWGDDTDDYVRTLVAGNIRAFSAWLRERKRFVSGDQIMRHYGARS